MDTRNIRLLIVTNSIPLPASDFLKDKIMGLNDSFELHLLCWDSKANKEEFVRRYPVKAERIHLYPNQKGVWNRMMATIMSFFFFLLHPLQSLAILKKIRANNKGLKNIIHEYILYAPLIKIKPGIIHFEFGTLAVGFKDVKDYFPLKASTSFRGYDLNYVALDDPAYYSKVWNAFDGYHFLGNDLKNRAIKRGYRQGRLEALIAPAIDTSLFSPAEHSARNTAKFIIVSTGRLVWKKGYEYGIRAVAALKQKGIPVEYRIIGDGDYMQAIQFTVFELGLQDDIVLLGKKNKEEIKQQLSEAHVFLHPAVSEGFCNAVLEAQAMGVPVVTTDADGLGENVVDGVTGFVVAKWDVAAMAAKLYWLSQHPAEATQMGRNGIGRVNKLFRLQDQVHKFKDFYRELYKHAGNS